ncbi:MAG: polysaccharide deacetylase family protein [Salibacteraceae bacterium]
MIYPKHTPEIIKPFAKNLVFDLPNDEHRIYLTFDDGPHPEITPWVLDQLQQYQAQATFFLIGENAGARPNTVKEIMANGNTIGNHSYRHLNGWTTNNDVYFKDIEQCAEIVPSNLLRPPYGRITQAQSERLKSDYRIIMWTDLSADFDQKVSVEQCVAHATKKIKSGSIVVFHDSEMAWPTLKKALPRCLSYYREQGFTMSPIILD